MKNKEVNVVKTDSYKSLSKKFKKLSKSPFFNTVSANEKKVKKLSELSREIDLSVLQIAPKRFIARKEQKLQKLSDLKQVVDIYKVDAERQLEIKKEDRQNSILGKIINAKNTVTDVLTKEIKPLDIIKKSLVDKKYKDKTSEEILSMVYGKPKKDNKKKKETPGEQQIPSDPKSVFDTAIDESSQSVIDVSTVSEKEDDIERINTIEDRLESIDKNIVLLSETIKEVSERSVDNQDTSIDSVKKNENIPTVIPLSNQKVVEKEAEKKDSWLSIISGLIGKFVSGWLASKVGLGLITSIIKNLAPSILSAAAKGLSSLASGAVNLASAGVDKAKKFIGAGVTKLSDMFKSGVDKAKDLGRAGVAKLSDAKNKVAKTATKLSDNVASKSGSILKKMTKFAKVVPILGTVLGVGSAAYSAVEGYNNAGEILGKSDADLTETEKLAAAAGAVVNDLSFGFISPTSVAEKIVNVFGTDEENASDTLDKQNIDQAEKINMEIPLDMSNASPEEKILIRKIKNIEQYILDDQTTLKNETNSDRIKVKKESIEKMYNELRNLYKEYNEKFYNAIPEVEKSSNMFNIEQTQESTVQNTRRFSRSNTGENRSQPVQNNNFSINTPMQENNFRAYDMFYAGE